MQVNLSPCEYRALSYFLQSEYESAIHDFQQIAEQLAINGQPEQAICHHLWASHFYILNGAYVKGQQLLEGIKERWPNDVKPGTYNYSFSKFIEANLDNYLGNRKEAYVSILEAQYSLKQTQGASTFLHTLILLLKGKVLYRQRDIAGAIHHFLEAIALVINHGPRDIYFMIGKALNLIAMTISDSDEKELAYEIYETCERVYRKFKGQLPSNHLYYGILYADKALCLLKFTDEEKAARLEKASLQLRIAQNIFESIYGKNKNHRYFATIMRAKARLLKEKKAAPEQIISLLCKKVDMRIKLYQTSKHHTIARAYNNITRAYIRKGQLVKASEYAEKALIATHKMGLKNGLNDFLHAEMPDPEKVTSKTELLRSLHNLAEIYLRRYRRYRNPRHAYKSYQTLNAALAFVEGNLKKLTYRDSKYILIKQTRPIQEQAFELLHLVYSRKTLHNYLKKHFGVGREEIFKIVRKNKAGVLRDAMNRAAGNNFETLDKKRIGYANLMIELSELEKEFKQFALEREYDPQQLVDRIQNTVGAYSSSAIPIQHYDAHLIYIDKDENITLEAIQNGFTSDAAGILSYFVGKNSMFAMLITPEKVEIKKLAYSDSDVNEICEKQINILLDLIKKDLPQYALVVGKRENLAQAQKVEEEYKHVAYELYQQLIGPFDATLKDLNRLYIIPDDNLWKIPFEALIQSTETASSAFPFYTQLDYLHRKYTISYHFSTLVLCKIHRRTNKKRAVSPQMPGFLFIAGEFENDHENHDSENRINNWRKLLEKSPRQIDTSIYPINTEGAPNSLPASPHQVLNCIAMHRFAMIYSHAGQEIQSDKYFFRLKLTNECKISPTEVRAASRFDSTRLLIINSCSSGQGPILTGEGVIALNRAFFEKGIPNQIYTIFDINDSFSRKFLTAFLSNCFSQKRQITPFAEAVNQTKLGFSNNPKYTPKDWASFAFIGDQTSGF